MWQTEPEPGMCDFEIPAHLDVIVVKRFVDATVELVSCRIRNDWVCHIGQHSPEGAHAAAEAFSSAES